MNDRSKELAKSEVGLVSILVSMVIMLIMTIVVVTYSQIINREQRQTLDRELNTQAYYAAESAINTVLYALNNGVSITDIKSDNSTCNTTSTAKSSLTKLQEFDSTHGTQYVSGLPTDANATITCLIVETSASSLTYNNVASTASQISHLQSANPADPISKIEVAWQDAGGNPPSYPPVNTKFPPLSSWQTGWPSVLQVEVVPWSSNPANNTPAGLYAAEQVFYLYPKSVPGGGTSPSGLSGDTRGEVIYGACDDVTPNQPKFCKATLSVPSGTDYYLKILPMYRSASVVVTPQNSLGSPITLSQVLGRGQIVVDVTAKSADIVKRISVASSADPSYMTPDYAIVTGSNICKRIQISAISTADNDCGGLN